MARRTEITAVHEDDTRNFLEKLDLIEAYRSGELRCVVCGEPLSVAGLGASRIREGEFVFACRKLECLDQFS